MSQKVEMPVAPEIDSPVEADVAEAEEIAPDSQVCVQYFYLYSGTWTRF